MAAGRVSNASPTDVGIRGKVSALVARSRTSARHQLRCRPLKHRRFSCHQAPSAMRKVGKPGLQGLEPSKGQDGIPHSAMGTVTPPPRPLLALSSSASAGEAQPMIGLRSTAPPSVSGTYRIAPAQVEAIGTYPVQNARCFSHGTVGPPAPRGLLPGAQEEIAPPPATPAAKAAIRRVRLIAASPSAAQLSTRAASQFRGKIPPFDIEQYLKGQANQ